MYVIGTAGHVDHGKSTLVQALTGIDPDRLREEKERGLTIDLGFAWLTLPSGEEVSIVDVPGHERFIKNMLAGVGGIDLALLVIACDEGVMPQTREHLAILDLLNVPRGVVALTKSDTVDHDWRDLVAEEARELVAGTSIGQAPVVVCSARSGDGIDELVAALESSLLEAAAPSDRGLPRLPIDRAFTMAGFGTVVTGTLLDGSLSVGEEVEILPQGARARIRGLQNHKQKVDKALPGRRTAVNLAGIAVSDLERGMLLSRPGAVQLVSLADMRLRVLPGQQMRHGVRCIVHHLSAEVEARVSLLDADTLQAAEGWAQIRLSAPLPLQRGDRVVLRSGGATLGGGQIVDLNARRHRRKHQPTLDRLEAMNGDAAAEALRIIEGIEPCTLSEYTKAAGGQDSAEEALSRVVGAGDVVPAGDYYFSADRYRRYATQAEALASDYHRRYPLRAGVPREEIRNRLGLSAPAASSLFESLAEASRLSLTPGTVALSGWTPALSEEQRRNLDGYVAALAVQPYQPVAPGIDPELAAYAEGSGLAVRVGDVTFGRVAYEEMVERITAAAGERPIALSEVRDMFGTSRRYAQAILEHLDGLRITRRVGDLRVLREGKDRTGLPR